MALFKEDEVQINMCPLLTVDEEEADGDGEGEEDANSELKLDTHEATSGANNAHQEEEQKANSLYSVVPSIRFRDTILTKKFGASPYDSDR